jgi:hypothetical protein
MGRTSRSRFRRFVSENFDGNIYIYSHPGVDRIWDIFKNDFQK